MAENLKSKSKQTKHKDEADEEEDDDFVADNNDDDDDDDDDDDEEDGEDDEEDDDEEEEDDDDDDDGGGGDEDEDNDDADNENSKSKSAGLFSSSDFAGQTLKRQYSGEGEGPEKKKKHKSKSVDEAGPKIVSEDFSAMDTKNIIPRGRRRAAIRSGLIDLYSTTAPSSAAKVSVDNEEEEEAEF